MSAATLWLAAVLFGGGALAATNGANDVSKGVATLVASDLATVPHALRWGTLWTLLGGAVGASIGGAMLATFGSGLFAAGTAPTKAIAFSILAGAALWVALATWTRWPVSTTHAVVGSAAGVVTAAVGVDGFAWGVVSHKVLVPLLISPLLAMVVAAVVVRWVPAWSARSHARANWASSAAVCGARAMNDVPKIGALVLGATDLVAGGVSHGWVLAGVVAAMSGGALVGGHPVTVRLAREVVKLDDRDGFTANTVAATLVGVATWGGVPLSTTHVASGGMLGAGARHGRPVWATVRGIGLAWLVTVPGAAMLGVLAFRVTRALAP